MPPWLRRQARPEVIVFFIGWLVLQTTFRERAFNDPGALWHVKVGEVILRDGFMTTDPFTYTFSGSTWIPQQWLGEIAMALAHRAAGLDGLLLGMTSLLAAVYTGLFARLVRQGMHPLLAGGIIGFALFCGAYHYYARPHMITIAFMAVTMAWLVDFEAGRVGLGRLFALVPLFTLWTNIHGGVLGGLMTLGLASAGWGLIFVFWRLRPQPACPRQADGRDSPLRSWRALTTLTAIVLTCSLTPFINPFGLEMLATWKRIVGSSAMKELVSEHQPLSLFHTAGQVSIAFLGLYLFVLAGCYRRVPRISWLLPLVWFAFTVQSIRQGPLFVITAVVAIAEMWPRSLWYELLKVYGDSLAQSPVRPASCCWWPWPAAGVLLVLSTQLAGVPGPVLGRGWARLDPQRQPLELRQPLQAYAAARPHGTRIFNDANLGGYVLYHAPQLKIFMDDRFELYGDDWLRNYVEVVYNTPEQIEEWADRYGFDCAVLLVEDERLPLEKYLAESPRWSTVERGPRGVMFRRLPPSSPDLAPRTSPP